MGEAIKNIGIELVWQTPTELDSALSRQAAPKERLLLHTVYRHELNIIGCVLCGQLP